LNIYILPYVIQKNISMRILCVIDNLGTGGSQRQLVELALGFKEKGNSVDFLIYYPNTFFGPILKEAGINITCINEPNYLKRLFKMSVFIRKGRYDAVLSFLEAANFICEFAGLPFRKWKLVVGERSANPNIERSFKLKFYRWFHLLADFVVANSHANMKIIRKINPLLSNSKCRVVYNIVDFKKWYRLNNDHTKKEKLNIVVAARHQYLKNLNGLIEALSRLPEKILSKIKVDWYGQGKDEPYMDESFKEGKKRIKELSLEDTISLHTTTHLIHKKVQEADAIGLFSFYEGFPNAICEGMACAKPIVCSHVSDVPELLVHEKELLCDPSNTHSIKQAISNLFHLSNEEIIRIGLENERIAKIKFDKNVIVSQYLNMLEGRCV